MATLEQVAALAREEHGLAVISTLRADATIQSSLVNAAVMAHPLTPRRTVVGVRDLRQGEARQPAHPAAADGDVSQRVALGGGRRHCPADRAGRSASLVDAERLRLLLREVFQAAGGQP